MDLWERIEKELKEVCEPLYEFYDIDKARLSGVYVWTKNDGCDGVNLFDIYEDEIYFFEHHTIYKDAIPIVEEIQQKLIELNKIFRENKNNK